MKKFLGSLPARLIIGVAAGIAIGLFCVDRWMFGIEIGSNDGHEMDFTIRARQYNYVG